MSRIVGSNTGQSLCSDVCQQCLTYSKTGHQINCKMWEILHILKGVSIKELDVIYENMKGYKNKNKICQRHFQPLDFYIADTKMLGCRDCVDFSRQRVNTISNIIKQDIQNILPTLEFNVKQMLENVNKQYQKKNDECIKKYRSNILNDTNKIKDQQQIIESQWKLFVEYRRYNEFIKLSGPKQIHSKLHTGFNYQQRNLMIPNVQQQNQPIDSLIQSYYKQPNEQ